MSKIKAVSVTFNEAGSMYVVDTVGQVWVKFASNGEWAKVELPEIPEEDTEITFG